MSWRSFVEASTKSLVKWELPVFVLFSLFLQLLLIVLGKRRKRLQGNLVTTIIWLAYLLADAIAFLSLGVLARARSKPDDHNSKGVDPDYVITAFWAPFLLLHLGGPDTITAYALEDNELWLRHLLGLVTQTLVSGYVFFRSLEPTPLNFISIPVYVAGLVKYGERTWSLWSASSEHFRDMMLPKPDAGPNYPKFVQLYALRKAEGYKASLEKFGDRTNTTRLSEPAAAVVAFDAESGVRDKMQERIDVRTAFGYFIIFKRLFADLILSFRDLQKSREFFQSIQWENAFKLIEIELGFVFDVLFTKACLIRTSNRSKLCRVIGVFATIAALLAFCLIDRRDYSTISQIVSFLLLCGAVCLEIYALIMLISDDWTLLWMSENVVDMGLSFFSFLHSLFGNNKRWSGRVGQYNLLTHCFKDEEAKCCGCIKLSWFKKIKEMCVDDPSEEVSVQMKALVFTYLRSASEKVKTYEDCRKECSYKGAPIPVQTSTSDVKLEHDLEIEIEHCIILWHIMTELIFYSQYSTSSVEYESCKTSRLLSNYMMFLVVKRPLMLPHGIGEIRVRDSQAEGLEFIRESDNISDEKELALRLLEVDCKHIQTVDVKGDRSKAVLFDACKLAHCIIDANNSDKEKWVMVQGVWIEILCYVASHCRWNHHAQQLRRGGEWLTHIWLLMAHFAITEQCQISQGHARTKLVLK